MNQKKKEKTIQTKPSELPRRLSASELIGIEFDIPARYWPSIERLRLWPRWAKIRHSHDTGYMQVPQSTWEKFFGDDKPDRKVRDKLKEKAMNKIQSYEVGGNSQGYRFKPSVEKMIADNGGKVVTQKEYVAMTKPKAAATRDMIRKIGDRLNNGKIPKKPVKLEDRFNTVDLNMRAMLIAKPILREWERHLEAGKSVDDAAAPNLLKTEVSELVESVGFEKTINYLELTRGQLEDCIAADGQFKQSYYRISTGRLQGIFPNLQQGTGLALKIALNGRYEFDINSCCHSIYLHIAEQADLEHRYLKSYVVYKKKWRKRIANHTGLSVDEVKTTLTTLAYGSAKGPKGSIRKMLGVQKERQLMTHPFVERLHQELRVVFKHIAKTAELTPKGHAYVNAAGKTKSKKDHKYKDTIGRSRIRKNPSDNQLAGFIVQGIESVALDSALKAHTSAILAKFDGWVCTKPEDAGKAEQAILDATGGFPLKLDAEPTQLLVEGLPISFEMMETDDWEHFT